MSGWAWVWLVWMSVFAVVEGMALANKSKDDTLSEHVWKWFHVDGRRPTGFTWVLRGLLLTFLVWLVGHLGFGVWSF